MIEEICWRTKKDGPQRGGKLEVSWETKSIILKIIRFKLQQAWDCDMMFGFSGNILIPCL